MKPKLPEGYSTSEDDKGTLELTLGEIKKHLAGTDKFSLVILPGKEAFAVLMTSGRSVAKLLTMLEKEGVIDRAKMEAALTADSKTIKS